MPLDEDSKRELLSVCWCCQCAFGSTNGKIGHAYSGPKDVLANSWWCCYCLCGGCGCGPTQTPMFSYGCKYLFCKNTCESTECSGTNGQEGFCGTLHRCCCCTQECQCPPKESSRVNIKEGSPRCVCLGCNIGSCIKDARQAIWDLWLCHLHCCGTDPWWICYCLCGGVGIHEVMLGRPLYFSSTKCCPIKSTCNSASPSDRDGCCMNVQQCLCWNTSCQLPPPRAEENPVCACCGMGGTSRRPACMPSNAPGQQSMGKSNQT
jgi:hypothetical protein